MELKRLIEKIVSDAKGEIVAVAYEGNKVEYQGETWYELIIRDHGGVYASWYMEQDGEAVYYDRDRLDNEDRIPEIDAQLRD